MVSSEEYPLEQQWDERLQRYVWVETEPDECPRCGASWRGPYTMRRGWVACPDHDGHRTWRCASCGEMMLNPPHEGELHTDQAMPSLLPGYQGR